MALDLTAGKVSRADEITDSEKGVWRAKLDGSGAERIHSKAQRLRRRCPGPYARCRRAGRRHGLQRGRGPRRQRPDGAGPHRSRWAPECAPGLWYQQRRRFPNSIPLDDPSPHPARCSGAADLCPPQASGPSEEPPSRSGPSLLDCASASRRTRGKVPAKDIPGSVRHK